jgi:phosphoglycolate phosphatase-like HAD superfamily hydrolase
VKVIFLDFDGVLVNRRSWYVRSGRTATADPPCVAALNRITDSTNAQIVVSSTWRIGMTIVELRNLLHAWGVTGAVLAKTPHMGFSVRRGSEIKAWIDMYEASRELVESFAILDDDDDMDAFSSSLVQTDFEEGLTEVHAEKAIALLNVSVAKAGHV